ncbi:MAG TPA: SpoIIE family protein phosphatase, partial [Bryobacteraceae bacterium]|nr:SpoIIE family protein phosphatase [Bryobacteraceae bacterium]
RASLEAIRIFRNHRDATPAELIALVHGALRSLRGAAVAAARIDEALGRVTFSGLGNVTAQIYANTRCTQRLVSMNGTAGHEVSRIQEFTCPWPSDGLLLMHSDGLSSSAGLETRPALARHDPTLIAGVLYRDFGRRHDDATVVVAKAA